MFSRPSDAGSFIERVDTARRGPKDKILTEPFQIPLWNYA